MRNDDVTPELVVEFCGEEFSVDRERVFSIGREGDLVVDADNPYLHRRLIELSFQHGFWWLANVGSRMSITVTGEAGTLHTMVSPGSRLPIVLPSQAVLFTAGETTYEVSVVLDSPVFETARNVDDSEGDMTLGVVELTPSQFLLVLSLAEDTLRRAGTGTSELPSNAAAAERLGWPLTRFNRKLDNVCEKFSRGGVKGLRGTPGNLATNRRARLVEYAVAARIVAAHHLELLDLEAGKTT